MATLLTWSDRGVTGPRPAHHGPRPETDLGPVLRLVREPDSQGRYDRAVVLTIPGGAEPAHGLAAELGALGVRTEVVVVDGITDPTDHGQIFRALGPIIERLGPGELDVLLSAGTPQMQTLWVILVQAGILRGRMLQVIPAAFVPVPHPRAIREVSLDIDGFPEIRALRDEVVRLRAQARVLAGELVGDSPAMHTLATLVARVAPTEAPVLILGETGTGKELLARAIHAASSRSGGPFIAENCGALPESVLASELFGHEPGAFTGASKRRRGLFELAHRGTLFLDEVAELSAQAQVTLLRVLQEGVLRRVGGESLARVDVRLVAATHRDLAAMVAAGSFRQDLYYRLRGVVITVPPLRERIGDLEQLVSHFLGQARRQLTLSRAAWQALRAYPWPGNIRELRAEVMRWTVLCDHTVDIPDLADEIRAYSDHGAGGGGQLRAAVQTAGGAVQAAAEAGIGAGTGIAAGAGDRAGAEVQTRAEDNAGMVAAIRPLAAVVADAERTAVAAALAACNHNLSQTARALGIDRNTLKRKLAIHGIAGSRGE